MEWISIPFKLFPKKMRRELIDGERDRPYVQQKIGRLVMKMSNKLVYTVKNVHA
jgi:hypothetical protein